MTRADWISAADRLPDTPDKVLIYTKNGCYCVARYNVRFGKWVTSGNAPATHWMPLPPSPEEKV